LLGRRVAVSPGNSVVAVLSGGNIEWAGLQEHLARA
jgi:hypothetical protein